MSGTINLAVDIGPLRHVSVSSAILGGDARDGGCMEALPLLLWHVAEVEPRQASLARQSLLAAGYQVIAPLVRVAIRLPNGRRGTTTQPLWPGYLLMGREPAQDWSAAYRARGVGGLIAATGDAYRPALVPQALVDWLLAHMTATGVVEGRTADGREISVPELLPALARNSRVRITRGPLTDHEGLCLWSTDERVALLLTVLGGPRRVTLRRDHVEAVVGTGRGATAGSDAGPSGGRRNAARRGAPFP